MAETDDRSAAGGVEYHKLEARLEALERRAQPALPERDLTDDHRARWQAELEALREAVDDLAADILDLHNQMGKVVSSFERIVAGAGGRLDLGDRRGWLRGSSSALRRAARRALHGTLGGARRLLGSRPEAPADALDLELRLAASPARRAPRIAVLLRVAEDPTTVEIPAALRAQTDGELEVVVWNEAAAKAVVRAGAEEPVILDAPDRSAVAAAVSADSIADVAAVPPRLEPTVAELCRWTLASEGLPLLVATDDGPVWPGAGWRVQPVEGWRAATGGRGTAAQPRLTKVVGSRRWHPDGLESRAVLGAGSGRAYLARRGRAGTLAHEVAPLAGVVAPLAAEDPRPAVLVTSSASDGGRLVGWLLRALGDELRFIVLLTDGGVADLGTRSALTSLATEVYPVAAWLEPAVWPSLAADLIRARGVGTVLRVGDPLQLPKLEGPRRFIVDWPLAVADVRPGADLVIASGGSISQRARAAGIESVDLVVAPELVGELPDAERLANVRSAYGVPDDARLVLAACDLEADRRPEDVAAVAWRLRHRDDIRVLLLGQGTLAGTVSDIAGYLGLERFAFAPPSHSLTELVAVCDCVLSTAERDPWPESIAAGLALGRHVVATDVDGVRELVAAADGDRCSLWPPGDVDGLARAVLEALDGRTPPRLTKKAWNAAAARSRQCLGTVREALGRAPADGQETR